MPFSKTLGPLSVEQEQKLNSVFLLAVVYNLENLSGINVIVSQPRGETTYLQSLTGNSKPSW